MAYIYISLPKNSIFYLDRANTTVKTGEFNPVGGVSKSDSVKNTIPDFSGARGFGQNLFRTISILKCFWCLAAIAALYVTMLVGPSVILSTTSFKKYF